jgi:hypothetical protein
MSAACIVRRSVVFGLAIGWVVAAAGVAEAQIFRRPAGASQPNAQPPRGLFPGRQSRGQNPDGQFPGQFNNGTFSGGAVPRTATPNTVNRPGATVPTSPQEEFFIVVPLDTKPFQIEPTDVVRLSAGGVPGCEFATKIEGPARLYRKVFIAGATEGKYAVGTDEAEFEFAMTGLGKVKIDVIVTVANGPPPTVMTYQFEVVPPKQ